ncbi:DUF397 domain-containing protein [Nocardia sp. NPDC051030]|uniref:DUF397 domain-containing protein n=1 Tax=Nocardia sp. NPDC051030 TaxID=3155162 RepID=UPI00341EC95C
MITPSQWQKSSFSGQNSDCVEVNIGDETVSIRDSKYQRDPGNNPAEQPVLTVAMLDWHVFVDAVAGRTACPGVIAVDATADGSVTLRSSDIALTYTPSEWEAFVAAIHAGEFDTAVVAALA